MILSEVGLDYVEVLTDFNRRQIIEMVQNKGRYSKYNRDKVITLYQECANYPSSGGVSKERRRQFTKLIVNKFKTTQVEMAKETKVPYRELNNFINFNLYKVPLVNAMKVYKHLLNHYNFDILDFYGLDGDYFKGFYGDRYNDSYEAIAEEFNLSYKRVYTVVSHRRDNPNWKSGNENNWERDDRICKLAKEKGLL